MTIDNCITYWALQYKEPLKATVQGKACENIILTDTRRWMHNRFDDSFKDDLKRIDDFCYYALDHYKPTANNPFPPNGHLTELYDIFRISKSPISQNEYKPITMQDTMKVFAEKKGVKVLPPDEYKNIDISKVAEDDKRLSKIEMLRKYGVLLCGELWSEGVYSRSKLGEA